LKRSQASVVLALVVGLLVLIVVATLVLRWAGAKARADELAALRASSQASLPEDLAPVDSVRPEPAPWLARVAGAVQLWEPGALGTPESFAALRERSQKGEFGPRVEAAFAALEACAGANAADAVLRVAAILEARDGIVDPPPCGRAAIDLMVLGHADQLAIAREASGFGPIDPRAILAQLEASGAAIPGLPAIEVVALRSALKVAVLQAAWNERPDEVVALLRAQRDVARIFEKTPLAIAGMIAASADLGLLESLELALPQLSREVDLAWLEAELGAIRPRDRLARAAEGERAFGNRTYEELRRGQTLSGVPGRNEFLSGLTQSFDQATFLRRTRAAIESMGSPAFRRAPLEEPGWVGRTLAPLATYLTPYSRRLLGVADLLEARIALARVALVAFRGNAQEALTTLPNTVDPYDGRPVRMALGPDGIVVLWSVGQDGVDDGGLDDQRDVVWRFKLR